MLSSCAIGELPIAMALASVVATPHMDELARVFVNLFDAKHLLYQLLWNMFSKEVSRSGQDKQWDYFHDFSVNLHLVLSYIHTQSSFSWSMV